MKAPDEPPHVLVRAGTIRAIKVGFGAALALAVAGDLAVHHHVAFGLEGTFGFNAWYGFLTCVGMVVAAKLLGAFLKRPDDYYDAEVKE
jgi:hypothetical protein